MRIPLISDFPLATIGLFLAAAGPSTAPAIAQSLLWSETTQSQRTSANPTQVHTEHARPQAWRSFLVPTMSEARLDLTFDYDVTFTNTGTVDAVGLRACYRVTSSCKTTTAGETSPAAA